MAVGGLAAAGGAVAGAARGGATLAGGATAAYRGGGASGVATSGLAKGAEAVISPLRRAAGSLKSSFEAGGNSATGEGSPRCRRRTRLGVVSNNSPPAWARRMKRCQPSTMAHQPPRMPFAPAITAAAAHRSISLKGNSLCFKTIRPLRPHARTRDALPEGGASLGRPYRLGAGPGEKLAVDGVRFAGPVGGLGAGSLVWQSSRGTITPWVVQVDRLGQAQAIAPATSDYRPTDPQIAYHLARFIEDIRGLPVDPIVLRQQWLRAYDFTTDRGAAALNDYARTNDPFAKLGKMQISVEVSSVIRASPDSFRVAWIQRAYENGSLATTERWTAILTVVIQTPRDADRLRKNPLGVYVNAINWSKELGQ